MERIACGYEQPALPALDEPATFLTTWSGRFAKTVGPQGPTGGAVLGDQCNDRQLMGWATIETVQSRPSQPPCNTVYGSQIAHRCTDCTAAPRHQFLNVPCYVIDTQLSAISICLVFPSKYFPPFPSIFSLQACLNPTNRPTEVLAPLQNTNPHFSFYKSSNTQPLRHSVFLIQRPRTHPTPTDRRGLRSSS